MFTSAGVTAADLTLALVEDDMGPTLARSVARMMVIYLQSPGNQAQISMFAEAPAPAHGAVQGVLAYIMEHLDGDLATANLAGHAGISGRHLARLFLHQLGQTAAQYVRKVRAEAVAKVRAEAVAHLLVPTTLPMASIAGRCGFSSTETMRQAFLDHFGTTPSQHRTVHQGARAASGG
ncbi:GlxA family transcriptional regulator [Streptomyces sp. NPDC051636]|uniref:GlxA family transcriptional regulator n=1 Tax=Streptomyces sp. NPDC051636 TaxID=3365663 RepID=UPI0037965E99